MDGSSNWHDINGNEYKSSKFIFDLIKMGKIKLEDVTVVEANLDFLKKGCILNPNLPLSKEKLEQLEKVSGSLGLGLLQSHAYWMLDFPRWKFLFIEDFSKFIKETKCSLKEYLEVPIGMEKFLPTICIDSDFGKKIFLIDT